MKGKKILAIILAAAMTLAFTACKGGGGSGKGQPEGLYIFDYYCDADGNYVAELNETTEYTGYPTTQIEMMYEKNDIYWVDIGADGTGKYHSEFGEDEELSLDTKEGKIWFGDIFHEYKYDGGNNVFWYGDDDFWYHMKPCTQQDIDNVYNGRGGSVAISEAEVGDLVCLGNYDTFPYNETTEPIYWRVLDKQDGKLLILSDKLLDSFSFNYDPELTKSDLGTVTWENCSLREFLNNEFLTTMFTEEEQALVQTVTLENKAANEELLEQWGSFEDRDGQAYSEMTMQNVADYPDTEDKVFLLSYQEVLKYFGEPTEEYTGGSDYPFSAMKENSDWKCLITQAVEYNAIGYYDRDNYCGAWMTRTISTADNEPHCLVTYITSSGQVFNNFTYDPMFIRPAMWISTGN